MPDTLADVDEKLKIVRQTIAELTRLEQFLTAQRAELAKKASASYLSHVRVSQQEIDAQVKRASELVAKWNPKR